LCQFFDFYTTKFNVKANVVSIRQGTPDVSKVSTWSASGRPAFGRLSIEDPFNLHHDLGSFKLRYIHVMLSYSPPFTTYYYDRTLNGFVRVRLDFRAKGVRTGEGNNYSTQHRSQLVAAAYRR
jgi:hypothetical protein